MGRPALLSQVSKLAFVKEPLRYETPNTPDIRHLQLQFTFWLESFRCWLLGLYHGLLSVFGRLSGSATLCTHTGTLVKEETRLCICDPHQNHILVSF